MCGGSPLHGEVEIAMAAAGVGEVPAAEGVVVVAAAVQMVVGK